jgi:hypothetical protein
MLRRRAVHELAPVLRDRLHRAAAAQQHCAPARARSATRPGAGARRHAQRRGQGAGRATGDGQLQLLREREHLRLPAVEARVEHPPAPRERCVRGKMQPMHLAGLRDRSAAPARRRHGRRECRGARDIARHGRAGACPGALHRPPRPCLRSGPRPDGWLETCSTQKSRPRRRLTPADQSSGAGGESSLREPAGLACAVSWVRAV